MTRRWPFLSASVVLLVATLFAPPARALDEPERLRLVGERTFGDALLLLGRARFALGDAESALEAFRRAQAATPPPASLEAKFWEAETLFRLRRFAEAHAAYDVVVKNDAAAPHAPDAAYSLAWSDLELRRPEAAVAEFRELLARWPEHPLAPAATLYLARTLAELNRFSDALPLLESFATKYPRHKQVPDAQYLLGWARVKSGDTKAGLADLRAFVAAAPNHELAPAARRTITETLTRSGDRSELQGTYKALMEQTPPTPTSRRRARRMARAPRRSFWSASPNSSSAITAWPRRRSTPSAA